MASRTRIESHLIYHDCIAIDERKTLYREDCILVTKEKHGYSLKIMAVIPDIRKLDQQAFISALEEQLRSSRQSTSIPIFKSEDRSMTSLNLRHARHVAGVEYRFNDSCKLTDEVIYVAKARLSKVISYEDFHRQSGMTLYNELTEAAIKAKHELCEKLKHSAYLRSLREDKDLGSEIIFTSLELFNSSLRTYARIHKIPFVSPPHHGRKRGFEISGGYARFNNGLRNPCSFINVINLVAYVKEEKPFFTKSELLSFLPKKL